MSKESYQHGLGRKFEPEDSTWGRTVRGRLLRRVGKTKRDKEGGAWANRLANRAMKAEENRRRPALNHVGRRK